MNRKIVIGLLGCLLLVGALLYFLDSPTKQELAAKKKISAAWDPEYQIESSDPRGAGFFNELLKSHVDDSVYIAKRFTQLDSLSKTDTATYLFIGKDFAITNDELDTLLTRIDSGATLFMSFDQVSENFYDRFFRENAFYWEYSNQVFVAMEDTSLAYYSMFQNDTIYDDWYTFSPDKIRDTLYEPFAFSMDEPIAFELNRGKGKVILHSMPPLFMNYQVITPNGFAHASYMLRRIPKDRPVIWLECGRWSNDNSNAANENAEDKNNGNDKRNDSYLQYIMEDPSLRWAFMLAIVIFLLYALFRAKRREAVLPGVPEKRNMSLAFVETLSSIYLSRNSPYGILQVLRKNFYMAVSRHFYIDLLNTQKREEDIKRLVEKSSFDKEELQQMLAILETKPADQSRINEISLGQVYRAIRKFYIKTGISKANDNFIAGRGELVLNRIMWPGAIAVLLGMFTLFRGMYALSAGSGYGILLVAGSFIFLYFGIRLLTVPVAKVTATNITLYRLLVGSKQIDTSKGLTYDRRKGETVLFTEEGKQLTLQHVMLSRTGKNALRLLLEHIKHKSA